MFEVMVLGLEIAKVVVAAGAVITLFYGITILKKIKTLLEILTKHIED